MLRTYHTHPTRRNIETPTTPHGVRRYSKFVLQVILRSVQQVRIRNNHADAYARS